MKRENFDYILQNKRTLGVILHAYTHTNTHSSNSFTKPLTSGWMSTDRD